MALVCALATGCDPAPAPTPAPAPQSPECQALAARVAAHPDSFHATPPALKTLEVPPVEQPRTQAGEAIRVRVAVDFQGKVMTDSITLTPEVVDLGYRRRLIQSIAKYTYRPALVDGGAVPGIATTEITLPRRM